MKEIIEVVAKGKRATLLLNQMLLKVNAGLRTDEFLVLYYLHSKPNTKLSVMNTGKQLGMSVITHTLDKLEGKDLADRKTFISKKAGDRRTIGIKITEKGEKKLQFILGKLKTEFPKVFKGEIENV